MGTRYTFMCNKCGYQVMTSGGHDFGMHAITDSHICNYANKIVDVTVREFGITYTKEEILVKKKNSETDLNFYVCPRCGSDKNLGTWDIVNHPYPKCNGSIVDDISSLIKGWG